MTDKEVMRLALNALITAELDGNCEYGATEALRAALAQPEQEPVAWWHDRGDVVDLNVSRHGTPLYFAPPQREWQGLTNEEKKAIYEKADSENWHDQPLLEAVEAKLKKKNGY